MCNLFMLSKSYCFCQRTLAPLTPSDGKKVCLYVTACRSNYNLYTQVQSKESELTSAKPLLPTTESGEGELRSNELLLEVHACAHTCKHSWNVYNFITSLLGLHCCCFSKMFNKSMSIKCTLTLKEQFG